MGQRYFETGSGAAVDEITYAAAVADPPWMVRKTLEEVSPCETGYCGVTTCGTCATVDRCAEIVAAELERRFPAMDWWPAIREVLGMGGPV